MNLYTSISELPKIGPFFSKKFERLGIYTIKDLFYHAPSKYLDYSLVTTINQLQVGVPATIHAKIISLKNIYSKKGLRMQVGSVEDKTGKIAVVWFNQPFLIKTLFPGRFLSLSGKVSFFNNQKSLISPDYEIITNEDSPTTHTGRLVPIYPETSGLSSKWIRTKIKEAYNSIEKIDDILPEKIRKREDLISLKKAIYNIHFPKNLKDVEKGRKRLAFDEFLMLHLKGLKRKIKWNKNKAISNLKASKSQINQFIKSLPFELTDSQKSSINEILKDLSKSTPMNRLLEGDVGSGKTVVAAVGAFVTFINGFQSVIMAPTQILAQQHYETFKKFFSRFNVRVSLITSTIKKVELGRSDIFIGTNALIYKKIKFDKVAYVVIDEQHRFGVEQRANLIKKSAKDSGIGLPHVLTMTATPIPRTIALTTYGDLDISLLKESPKGRQKITTWIVPEEKRQKAYEWIKKQIKENKSQVFIVCPLIEDSETETLADVKSVKSEFERLKNIFLEEKLGLLHGRLKQKEKDQVLNDFRNKKIDILVTTPVVEVGIDIPNATIMVIEASERFGLAGLHQLRGRIGRGTKKSYCLLFSNYRSGRAYSRLKAMEKTYSGFELAEIDLKMRGPGEIFGTAQSGFPKLKIASWSNYELIKKSRKVAEDIIQNPLEYPKIINLIERYLHVA